MSDRHSTPHVLRTSRVLLRQWRDDDREAFAAMNADPQVMEYFPAPLSRTQSDAMAERCAAGITERGWGLWAAEVPGIAHFIGFVGLAIAGPGLPCAGATEVGWRLAHRYWGQGYATEAAQAAVGFAFCELQVDEVVSFTAVINRRSEHVMRKLGMTRDPMHFEHPRCPEGSAIRPHVLYRLRNAEWPAARR